MHTSLLIDEPLDDDPDAPLGCDDVAARVGACCIVVATFLLTKAVIVFLVISVSELMM